MNDDGKKQHASKMNLMKESGIDWMGIVEGGLLLLASFMAIALGTGFLFADERMLGSSLNYFFSANEASAPAIGLIFISTGLYWLWAAIGVFRGDREPARDLRCFFGGNGLLLLSALCIASAIGGFSLDYETFTNHGEYQLDEGAFEEHKKAAPAAELIVAVAGLYWLWAALVLLRGNRAPIADLRCFVGGHFLLFASMASLASGIYSFFDKSIHATAGVLLTAAAAYWLWTAARLLRGNRRPVLDLGCFFVGHFLLFASIGSFVIAIRAFSNIDGFEVFGYGLGLIFVVTGGRWLVIAVVLLSGNSSPIARPIRFVAANVFYIIGVFFLLTGLVAFVSISGTGATLVVFQVMVGIFCFAVGGSLMWLGNALVAIPTIWSSLKQASKDQS